jgi:hypothetical protein
VIVICCLVVLSWSWEEREEVYEGKGWYKIQIKIKRLVCEMLSYLKGKCHEIITCKGTR